MSVHQMAVGQMAVGQMPVGQMPVGQRSVAQMPFGQRPVSNLTFYIEVAGAVFTRRMGPISWSVFTRKAFKPSVMKHYSLFGSIINLLKKCQCDLNRDQCFKAF